MAPALLHAFHPGLDSVPEVLSNSSARRLCQGERYKFIVRLFRHRSQGCFRFGRRVWRLKVFSENSDIYCASASAMFHVPVENTGRTPISNRKAKSPSWPLDMADRWALSVDGRTGSKGLPRRNSSLVDAWRTSNQTSCSSGGMWTMRSKQPSASGWTRKSTHGIRFRYRSGMLFIVLRFRPAALLCEAEDGDKQVRRRFRHLRGIGAHKEIRTHRKILRPEIPWKTSSRRFQNISSCMPSDTFTLLYCRPCP